MELMFDMQQYGQPPAEIIKDLAPGLKFDENGMPIMPNMGAGMMPGEHIRCFISLCMYTCIFKLTIMYRCLNTGFKNCQVVDNMYHLCI